MVSKFGRISEPKPWFLLFIDGCSFPYAHTWSKSDISICWRHLVTSKESSNSIFFSWKRPILHHTCATWSELPSYISTMIRIRSLHLGLSFCVIRPARGWTRSINYTVLKQLKNNKNVNVSDYLTFSLFFLFLSLTLFFQ